jgi:predicted DNA-binding helix-hairpin-helix protein
MGIFLDRKTPFVGIGPRSADRILAARRETHFRDLSQLRALGVTITRAAAVMVISIAAKKKACLSGSSKRARLIS